MYSHFGLYFTEAHVKQAREQRAREPFQQAWVLLDHYQPPTVVAAIQYLGLRYRFVGDLDAGERALREIESLDVLVDAQQPYIAQVASLAALTQGYEMLCDHPANHGSQSWHDRFMAALEHLEQPYEQLMHVDLVWLNLLHLVAGIILEDSTRFDQAVETFKRVIDHDVHPEGYISKAVHVPEGQENYYGGSLYRMLLTAQALVLTAEAATHAGTDLWQYENRGVSAMTPTPYLLYYYYFPEKWHWETGLALEPVQAFYREHAGLWDIAQRQLFLRDRKVLLDELQPIYDVWGGGLTTLTHGTLEHRRRRGWFG
ncbi:MAG: alginate lyase family protein [Anaerolineae bacterium]|nr:alginate lyase family protein [Anaerolineae bacterium]